MIRDQPPGLKVLFFAEMWERFSYYGMRSLLLLYMVQAMHLGVERASAIYGLYTGLVFLTPTLGGYLADKYLGQRRAIVVGGLLMALGHFVLMLPSTVAFMSSLVLLILGCGLFKPNVSVLVGQLFEADDPRREPAFGLFYLGINIGAFISPLICGTLGQRYGWHWGFGSAGLGMLTGLTVFAAGQHTLKVNPSPSQEVCLPCREGGATLDAAVLPHFQTTPQNIPVVSTTKLLALRFGVLLALAVFGQVVFWAVFEQAGSSLAIFAEESTQLSLGLSHVAIPSSWFQAANPMFIALLTPALAAVWPRLKNRNQEPSVPFKFVFGLVCVALGFLIMAQAGAHADVEGRVSPAWLLSAYFFNTLGELCISPTGLAIVTRLAPPQHMSSTMGAWFASMALGNFLAGQLASTYGHTTRYHFFLQASVVAFGASVALAVLAPVLTRGIARLEAEDDGGRASTA